MCYPDIILHLYAKEAQVHMGLVLVQEMEYQKKEVFLKKMNKSFALLVITRIIKTIQKINTNDVRITVEAFLLGRPVS